MTNEAYTFSHNYSQNKNYFKILSAIGYAIKCKKGFREGMGATSAQNH